jgi:virulence factor Mce-like protein
VRRALAIAAVLAAVSAFVALTTGAGGDRNGTYWVELDNAFGLIEGGDLKVAGVRAGQITKIKLDRRTRHALVGFRIRRTGFGSLRTDVHCESRPQSLIGEYFLDCLPGTARTRLKPGARIPVQQTASTIAPDLVNDILREPERERLRIIISELGAGVAGRGPELNAAIRRAIPALRESDRVVGDLAKNRKDVGRFVTEANATAQASAERRRELAAGFERLPGFLEELQPTMKSLGEVADRQTPALQNLDASAQRLTRFLDLLAPFAQASRLDGVARGTPETAKDLAIILEHLDDRDNAIEADPRSPGGKGYTGLEALLQYVYDQTLSTSTYDQNSHIFKVALFDSACADYTDLKRLKDHPELERQCASRLGPTQPGITMPDVTRFEDPRSETNRAVSNRRSDPLPAPPSAPALPTPAAPKAPDAPKLPPVEPAPAAPAVPGVGGGGGVKPPAVNVPQALNVPKLPIPGLPPVPSVPNVPPLPGGGQPPGGQQPPIQLPGASATAQQPSGTQQNQQLLDYLLRP